MDLIVLLLDLTNETLAAAIVVLAASILLYNITRNLGNRVARTSAIVLACVTIAYIGDVFIALGPGFQAHAAALRFQWLGIAFVPAALFHLSDALLATTGLPSRGRRRRVGRTLYGISLVFLVAAIFTNSLIEPVSVQTTIPQTGTAVSLRAGILFPIYVLFFILAVVTAFINTNRARLRCLTRDTRRRMGYLQIAMLTPAVGIFPYSVVIGTGTEYSLLGLILVNIANFGIVLMLLFLAYPLSFFGSSVPDRIVKRELLRFILRGPMTGLLALGTYIFTNATRNILGLQGEEFTPFAIVAVILLWQWLIALSLLRLERRLVYAEEDVEQVEQLSELSERLLTRNDLLQLIDAILAAVCDYLRVNAAFIASYQDETYEVVRALGSNTPNSAALNQRTPPLKALLGNQDNDERTPSFLPWHDFTLAVLTAERRMTPNGLIGILGFQARAETRELNEDEQKMLMTFRARAAEALEDLSLQSEIYAALEGLLPQIHLTRRSAGDIEFRPGRSGAQELPTSSITDRTQFNDQVKAALRHYWGGPGLTKSRLLELTIVNNALEDNDNNAPKALRAVLNRAIELTRPDGERKPLSPEWTLYNILELRYLKGLKVREVATRLALSEPDFYRKQRMAIDHVADTLYELEVRHRQSIGTIAQM